MTSNSNETAVKSLTSPTRPSDQLAASVSGSLHSSPVSEDPFSIAASQPAFGTMVSDHTAFNSNSASLEPLFGASTAPPTTFGSSATGDAMFGSSTFAPSFGANPALFAPASVSNPFVAPPQPVMVLPQTAWVSPVGSQGLSLLFYIYRDCMQCCYLLNVNIQSFYHIILIFLTIKQNLKFV